MNRPISSIGFAITQAKELVGDMSNLEYTRGVCELLARLYPIDDVCTEDRAEWVEESLLAISSESNQHTVRCNDCWWHGDEEGLAFEVAADYPDDDAANVCPQCRQIGCLMDLESESPEGEEGAS